MAGLMDLWDKSLPEMEAEIDQNLPAGKYVLRFGKAFKRVDPNREDPTKEDMSVSLSFNAVRPLEGHVDGWNPGKYKTVWHRFRDGDAAQFIRFLKTAGFDGSMKPEQFLASQTGRQFVADIAYSPNAKNPDEPWMNVKGLRPLDVYEAQMAKVTGLTAPAAEEDSGLE